MVLWQRLAEITGEYLSKGGKGYLEGRLQTRCWEDKQTGQKTYMTEIVASDLVLLDGRKNGDADASSGSARNSERDPADPTVSSPINDQEIPF